MSQSKVEIIREHFAIAPFVAPHTNGLKRSGPRFFVGRCPFHQTGKDRPNKRKFWVNPEKGICGCFVPGCEAHGKPMDVINFYARLKSISNSQAISELWEMVPPSVKEKVGDVGQPV